MRIIIDMQGAQTESRFRGIGRYTMSFAQAVARNRGEHEIVLALSGLFPDTIEPIRAAFDGLLPQENIRVWHAPGPVCEEHPGNETRREVAELIREAFLANLQADVIHVSSLFEGYVDDAVTSIGRFDTRTPVSVTLYDLIPLLNPDHYLKPNPRYEQYYRRKAGYLRQARRFLAISEFTRQEGVIHIGASESEVVNVWTAIEPHFRPLTLAQETASQLRQKFGLTRPFVLYTGGADERKNLPRLIQAWASLPPELRRDHHLLFAGKMPDGDTARFRQIAHSSGMKPDDLRFTGYVSDEELVQLYNLCALYVFPSWHEGFGLPALEAMACGAPVIGANTSSLPEVIGLDEALFDPMDVSAIVARMRQALLDEEFRDRLRTHGLRRAQQFSWDETARRAIAAWATLSGEPVRPSPQTRAGRKPRLAFVSPLPPERTGIADYSAELLPALAEHYEIEIVVAQGRVTDAWVDRHGRTRDIAWLKGHAHEIDRVLYQLGNSPFHRHMLPLMQEVPGTVVMHDFYMSGLMAWMESRGGAPDAWVQALYAAHGYVAVRAWHRDPAAAKRDYPVNLDPIRYANGIIVHSQYSKHLAQTWYGKPVSADWAVIPLLRGQLPISFDRNAAKQSLGFAANNFVICSFGFLDESKLNHRLLECWLRSRLSKDGHCHLVFVGENHGGEYGSDLLRQIEESGVGERVRITGFVSGELFHQYLTATDIAVQLRTHSRGETSAAVLDCMNHGLPVIVNANGSMAELDARAVWMLPDEFADHELIRALETLWHEPETRRAIGQGAQAIIHERHAPSECARLYAAAIERFHERSQTSVSSLLQAIAAGGAAEYSDGELLNLSRSIAVSLPLVQPARCIFLDITATHRNDLKTGIERVARALVLAMIEAPPPGYRIEPVYLECVGGEWLYRHAYRYTLGLLGCPVDALDDEIVEPECGDILLGLDLSGEMLVQAQKAGLYAGYRNKGIEIHYIVHDLLPIRMPEVFPPVSDQIFDHWLHAISTFDGAIGVSKTVADDLEQWRKDVGIDGVKRKPFRYAWSHHGADMGSSSPTRGLPANAPNILVQLQTHPSFLMVGTVEPRKGYLQTIDAFSRLWQAGADINLVIVGKEGWQGLPDDMRRDIPQTIQRLRIHPERNKRLFWLEGISDEYLEKVYAASTCLIAASYGEGFGLPLIEAAQHKLPIIARDIPVFREVAGEHAYYFQAETPDDLAQGIRTWLGLYRDNRHPKSDEMPWLTWQQSAQNLMALLVNPVTTKHGGG